MIDALQSLFTYDFMRNALYASLLVGIVCGLVGTLVVLNRIVFLGGGLPAAYGVLAWRTILGTRRLERSLQHPFRWGWGGAPAHQNPLRYADRSDGRSEWRWGLFVSLTPVSRQT